MEMKNMKNYKFVSHYYTYSNNEEKENDRER